MTVCRSASVQRSSKAQGQPLRTGLTGALDALAPRVGERDQLPSAVPGVGVALDQPVLVEHGERGGHRLRAHPSEAASPLAVAAPLLLTNVSADTWEG